VGYTQVSVAAAQEGARWGGPRGLAGPTEDTARARLEPTANLRLGGLYLARLLDQLGGVEDDPELRFLRALAGYLAGPGEAWVRAPEAEFRRAAGARPEVRRYLRQAILMLGLSRRGEAWREALEGPEPWPREAERLRAWRTAAWCEVRTP
jgi:hypothetical protein